MLRTNPVAIKATRSPSSGFRHLPVQDNEDIRLQNTEGEEVIHQTIHRKEAILQTTQANAKDSYRDQATHLHIRMQVRSLSSLLQCKANGVEDQICQIRDKDPLQCNRVSISSTNTSKDSIQTSPLRGKDLISSSSSTQILLHILDGTSES
jgi:hypothetical protein